MLSIATIMPEYLNSTGFLIAAAIIVSLFVLYRLALPKPYPGIPYNKAAAKSIFGDVPGLLREIKETGELGSWLPKQCKALGSPVVQVFVRPFDKPMIVCCDPNEAYHILSAPSRAFDRTEYFIEAVDELLPGWHLSMKTGPLWKARRKLVSDAMTPTFLAEVAAPRIYEALTDLIDLWSLKADLAAGNSFEARDDLNLTARDAIWALSVGDSARAVRAQREALALSSTNAHDIKANVIQYPPAPKNPGFDSIGILAESIEYAQKAPFPVFAYRLIGNLPIYRRARQARDKLIDMQFRKATDNVSIAGEKSTTTGITCAIEFIVFRELQAAGRENRAARLDSEGLKVELLGFLLGGSETTASVASWLVKYIAANKQAQQKLRHELEVTFDVAKSEGRSPTVTEMMNSFSAGHSMAYMHAVVEETLRCAAIIFGVARMAKQATSILGYHVPEGANIMNLFCGPGIQEPSLNVKEENRSGKKVFTNWTRGSEAHFIPERWLKVSTDAGGKHLEIFDPRAGPTIPFGAGSRTCFGKRLAYLQLRMFAVLLVWNFELLDTVSVNDNSATTKATRIPNACHVNLRRVERG